MKNASDRFTEKQNGTKVFGIRRIASGKAHRRMARFLAFTLGFSLAIGIAGCHSNPSPNDSSDISMNGSPSAPYQPIRSEPSLGAASGTANPSQTEPIPASNPSPPSSAQTTDPKDFNIQVSGTVNRVTGENSLEVIASFNLQGALRFARADQSSNPIDIGFTVGNWAGGQEGSFNWFSDGQLSTMAGVAQYYANPIPLANVSVSGQDVTATTLRQDDATAATQLPVIYKNLLIDSSGLMAMPKPIVYGQATIHREGNHVSGDILLYSIEANSVQLSNPTSAIKASFQGESPD